jgi:MATE family multidrug resistance protein
MAINIVVYWAIAFPLAFLAAVTYKAPPDYIWGGFVVGLSIAAVLLTWRFARISRRVVLQEQA